MVRTRENQAEVEGTVRSSRPLRRPRRPLLFVVALLSSAMAGTVRGEEYDYGYGQQPMPQMPPQDGGGGVVPMLASCVGGLLGSKFLFSWRRKKNKSKALVGEMQKLGAIQRLQKENLIQQTAPLLEDYIKEINSKHLMVHELEVMLYKLPDVNQDNLITRSEFNTYMSRYKETHPELTDRDLPRFEDMDHDRNGHINFNEWEEYQALAMTGGY